MGSVEPTVSNADVQITLAQVERGEDLQSWSESERSDLEREILISSIIAAYGDWGFTQVRGVSGGWIGIVWVWNIVWFFPLDFVKFGVRALVRMYNTRRGKHAQGIKPVDGVPITRTQSRHESL
ncbi:hypothetical protein JCM3775_003682 [Rhodotorula graminis]